MQHSANMSSMHVFSHLSRAQLCVFAGVTLHKKAANVFAMFGISDSCTLSSWRRGPTCLRVFGGYTSWAGFKGKTNRKTLGDTSPFFPKILLSREPSEPPKNNDRFFFKKKTWLKRMEKESTPRVRAAHRILAQLSWVEIPIFRFGFSFLFC